MSRFFTCVKLLHLGQAIAGLEAEAFSSSVSKHPTDNYQGNGVSIIAYVYRVPTLIVIFKQWLLIY